MSATEMKDTKSIAAVKVADHPDDSGIDSPSELVVDIYIDPEKEKAALRKFDKWLVPVAFCFLVLSSLDRNNLGNARVFGLDADLGLHGGMFGNLTTVVSVTLIVFEIPWVIAVKRFGANRALGSALLLWSVVTLGTAFVRTYAQAVVARLLLGACEAGISPGFAYLFATIYPQRAAGKRVMMTNLANCTSGAFGGLFAYAVQTMGARRGLAAWRWLFIVEFCVTIVIGGIGWSVLPHSPEDAWFLSAEEKETMRFRRLRDEAFRGRDEFDSKWIKAALKDPFIYVCGLAFFTSSVAITGFGVFLPTIIAGLGYESLKVNYMTIPVYCLGAVSLVTNCYFSDKINRRAPFLIGCCIPVIAGYLTAVGSSNSHAGYAGMFILVLGVYPISTLVVAWVGTNISPDSKRAFALPYFYSIGNLSMLVSSQLYPSQQGPRYVVGNATSAGLEVVAACLYVASWLVLRRRNIQKKKLIAEGATTNGQVGDRSLNFIYGL
ncbi:major facilitator superfamily domain-containing protein [Hypoxylon rubiginosum]|uniref:Major facilitator superfamily domain-containing protein n=1 Tax=Hypoxylon rubiginosum TaxID=110542 RepID=A0ACB9Z1Z6_9PEZI|nr:major facilitator superfamily domain-containing protein [Hypoxylon rubiginosum]